MDTSKIQRAFNRQRSAGQDLRVALERMLLARHEAGRGLNAVFGDGPIPEKDLAELAKIDARNYSAAECELMRQFARRYTAGQAPSLIGLFGTWTNICKSLANELAPKQKVSA
jgi:hypothetical protein